MFMKNVVAAKISARQKMFRKEKIPFKAKDMNQKHRTVYLKKNAQIKTTNTKLVIKNVLQGGGG